MTALITTGTPTLASEIARRRTFAIISHPDAGKTTLTEKLLLYAGAIDLAGSVRARKNQRRSTSDWMALEQQRGISVTATALAFDCRGMRLNLLDTPGHQDFSEDTYRTLMAVDSAVMVIDAAKGIEPQTRKLFDVCRRRGIPILTFVNKLDHPSREPLELLDELEAVLGISVAPMNWPIGDGPTFQGVYDLERQAVLRFERTARGQRRAPVRVASIDDPTLEEVLGETATRQLRGDVALVTGAGETFDHERFLAGVQTPVYFGSALNNFGVETFLEAIIRLAPPPGPRLSDRGPISPTDAAFSGFIFKIQANMDPQHRDCMAFLRVCSGVFAKGMLVEHPRLGRSVRLARPHRLFAQERDTIEEAVAGDIVGLVNPGIFAIGDTISTGQPIHYDAIPRFQPECFARLVSSDTARTKQLAKGLAQLEQEGTTQVFFAPDGTQREVILGAVGELQFDVVVARLAAEYGVSARIERLPYSCSCWINADAATQAGMDWPRIASLRLVDRDERTILLFGSVHQRETYLGEHPDVAVRDLP